MTNYIAQSSTDLGDPISGIGPLGLETGGDAPSLFAQVISGTIGLMTIIAAIWFLFTLVTGAIGIISSGGDQQAYESARKRIATGVIGIVVVIAAIFIMDLIATILGIPSVLNIQAMISRLTPSP